MGIVYEAYQRTLGRRVALKVLSLVDNQDQQHLLRFQREARAAARLHHTNIVPVFDVGSVDGLHFYSMQFIDGQSLQHVWEALRKETNATAQPATSDVWSGKPTQVLTLARQLSGDPFANTSASADEVPNWDQSATASVVRAFSACPRQAAGASNRPTPQSASHGHIPSGTSSKGPATSSVSAKRDYFDNLARVALQILDALAYAHRQQIIHRDIKPSNVILDVHGRAWLADFGLAKSTIGGLTQTGDVVGTLRYMSPERFKGRTDARSDIYSAGLTLYEFLTLRSAFEADNHASLMNKLLHESPQNPRKIDSAIPSDLETIVLHAIEKDPNKRYQRPVLPTICAGFRTSPDRARHRGWGISSVSAAEIQSSRC
jgi:serine/threonine protein kinase